MQTYNFATAKTVTMEYCLSQHQIFSLIQAIYLDNYQLDRALNSYKLEYSTPSQYHKSEDLAHIILVHFTM